MVKHATIRLLMASALLAATSGCSSPNGSDGSPPAQKSAANTEAEADAAATQDTGAAPAACRWDARLDRGDDAPRGACHAKRHLVSCSLPGDATEICLSDEPQCTEQGGESACEDQCEPNEYAIVCGAIGPDTGNPDPPADCHGELATPAGTFFMCCPCE